MTKQIKVNATGETITFSKTSSDTNGEFVEAICTLPSGKQGPPKHIHTLQTEFLEVIEGNVLLIVGEDKKILEPGQSCEVPANTIHSFNTAGNEDIKFKAIFKPALDIEWFLTEIFASMNRANSTKPSIFEASYILSQTNGQYFLADVPLFVQKNIFPVLATFSKTCGLVKKVNTKK